MPFDKKHFDRLFFPKRVAIIGASTKADKVGYAILKNMIDAGYQGEILPVNPNEDNILGLKVYSDITRITGNIDLAIIAVKAKLVPEVLKACHLLRIDTMVVISAGFKETGTTEGQSLEKELLAIAQTNDLLVIGPNCLGIVNTASAISLNATFAKTQPRPGNIAFISQSGAIGIHALEFAHKHDIGFSKFVTIGNKSVTNENDLISYFNDDPETKVILIYLESFADGERFRDVVKKKGAGQQKPIILLKSGRSESGKKAALSHTGALASADDMITYFLEDCGVIRVDTMEEMFTTAMVVANQPVPGSNRLAVLTNAGGLGIMAIDAAEKYGLEIAKIPKEVQVDLKKFLPLAASVNNPVDILGDAYAGRYQQVLKLLLQFKVFDMLLIICTPQFMTDRSSILKAIKDLVAVVRKKNIAFVAVFPAAVDQEINNLFDNYDLPNYEFPEQAIKALAYYHKYVNLSKTTALRSVHKLTERKYKHLKKSIDEVVEKKKGYLNEIQSYEVLKEYGIPIAKYSLAHDLKDALVEGKKLGFPLVAKIVASGVIHKFDIGGVVVNIKDERQLIEAYEQLSILVTPDRFKGVLLQTMVNEGIELIMGTKYHRGFGHAVMFGLGGTYVEVMEDVSFAMAPLTKAKARKMVESIKGVKLLNGYRSKPPVNKEGVVNLLLKLSQIVNDFPKIKSLDLNPVFASERGVLVADARVIL
jgi:acetate---CoA ligase (ADP-forming)